MLAVDAALTVLNYKFMAQKLTDPHRLKLQAQNVTRILTDRNTTDTSYARLHCFRAKMCSQATNLIRACHICIDSYGPSRGKQISRIGLRLIHTYIHTYK